MNIRGREDKRTREQEDKKTREQEDKKTRGQENKRTRGQENKRTREQENKRTRKQENKRTREQEVKGASYRLLTHRLVNNKMKLKNVIESPCGLRFMLDGLDLQSGFARRWLLDTEMMTSEQEIAESYGVLQHFVDFVRSIEPSFLNTLLFRLQGVKDIGTTIKNLRQSSTLDDIELFEVKHLAILSTEVVKLLKEHNLDAAVEIPPLDEVMDILDPDGMKIATFYIYDS